MSHIVQIKKKYKKKFVDHYQFSKLRDRCKNMLTNLCLLTKWTSWNIVQQIMYDIFLVFEKPYFSAVRILHHISHCTYLKKTWVWAHFGIQQIFWVNEKLIQFVCTAWHLFIYSSYTFADAMARSLNFVKSKGVTKTKCISIIIIINKAIIPR